MDTQGPHKTIQDRGANFRDDEGNLYLVRCYACDSERGVENYAMNVALGICTWCYWSEKAQEVGA